ncbi:MAG TPA: DUF4340 domain-containing protein [Casimicrobiaceae bacterium]|jgi:hypothetical protein|nr:DUF4340 domain-containing protein [Casimicrobiaceae bacterium]
MRGVRSLIVLLVIAIPLGWYALHESKQPATSDTNQEKVFPDLKADAIDQVTVKSASGDRTTAIKKGGDWELSQPLSVKADQAELSGITSNLASLEVQRVIDEQPTDLKQYSLDPARIEIDFRSGGRDHKLLLGQKTPTASDMYAKLPDKPRVFLIASYLDTTFNRSTFDLRDKTVLAFDRDKVDRVTLKDAKRTIALAKQGADWALTSPVEARADFSTVEGLVGRINTAQMKAITSTDASDLKQYGLDAPASTITIASGSATASLAIGKKADDGTVYAKDASRPLVFTIDSAIADDMAKPIDDFRQKDLFDARSFNTTRIEIVRNGQTRAFERAGDKWKQVAPDAKDVDAAKVDALLTALTSARATGFVEKSANTGLDKPEIGVTIKYENGQKTEHVDFGKHASDVFAQRQGEQGVAKVDAATFDAIVKALDGV